MGRFRFFLITILLSSGASASDTVASVIDYVSSAEGHWKQIVDTRPEAVCRKATLPGARCLPVNEFIGPHKRLVNISGILWLLGSAGLTGEEHLLVIGDRPEQKELMAGLLYLAGQKRISVLKPAVKAVAGERKELKPGRNRSKTREVVYAAPMRDQHVLLRGELHRVMASTESTLLLDGRSESEYWGQRVRGFRGGHLPGAQLLPSHTLSDGGSDLNLSSFSSPGSLVVYGHDTAEGLVYLSRLVAKGIEPRLYLEGWVGWASDGALPVDSLTYRDSPALGRPVQESAEGEVPWTLILSASLAAIGLAAGGFYLGRMTTK